MNEFMEDLGEVIIGCAIEVHRVLGPGMLESCYESCLEYELKNKGLRVERQKPVAVNYKGIVMDNGYRIDLLVEGKIVLELKAVEKLTDVHQSQILTYMRLGGYKLGYLINFNQSKLVSGLKRYVM